MAVVRWWSVVVAVVVDVAVVVALPSIGGWGGGLVRFGTGTAWGAGELLPSGCRCRCCRGLLLLLLLLLFAVGGMLPRHAC